MPVDGPGARPRGRRGGAAGVHGRAVAGAARVLGGPGRRADAPTRWPVPALTPGARATDGHDPRAATCWTGTPATRNGRSRSSTSRAPRGRTSARSRATSARPLGNAAYLGALVRTQAGAFTLDDALPLDTLREAANERSRSDRGAAPSGRRRPGDACPACEIGAEEVAALARGQRGHGPQADSTRAAAKARRCPDPRSTDGPIVAIGHIDGGRAGARQGAVRHGPVRGPLPAPSDGRGRRRRVTRMDVVDGLRAARPARARTAVRGRRACSTGSIVATATCCDGWSKEAARRGARPAVDHVRRAPRRDPHGLRAAAAGRSRRAPGADRPGRRRGDGRPALRPCAARDAVRRRSCG